MRVEQRVESQAAVTDKILNTRRASTTEVVRPLGQGAMTDRPQAEVE